MIREETNGYQEENPLQIRRKRRVGAMASKFVMRAALCLALLMLSRNGPLR